MWTKAAEISCNFNTPAVVVGAFSLVQYFPTKWYNFINLINLVAVCDFFVSFYWLYIRVCTLNGQAHFIYKAVDPWHCTVSNKVIMHKHDFCNVVTAQIPRYTFSATIATNWIMRWSFEHWMERDVFSWKTLFVKRLTCVRVACGAEKENCAVTCEVSLSCLL